LPSHCRFFAFGGSSLRLRIAFATGLVRRPDSATCVLTPLWILSMLEVRIWSPLELRMELRPSTSGSLGVSDVVLAKGVPAVLFDLLFDTGSSAQAQVLDPIVDRRPERCDNQLGTHAGVQNFSQPCLSHVRREEQSVSNVQCDSHQLGTGRTIKPCQR